MGLIPGQRYDAAVGLYDYRARWYAPALGRFIQPDTIVPNPGDPQALNRYSYAGNNPVRYTDPSGHCIGVLAGLDTIGCVGVGVIVGGTLLVTALVVDQVSGTNYTGRLVEKTIETVTPVAGDLVEGYQRNHPEIAVVKVTSMAATGFLFTRHSRKAIQSMADHLGFMFGYGGSGINGFPDPFNRHDPKKTNSLKNNAKHIRNSLKGIQRNLGETDLRAFLNETLTEEQYTSLTNELDNLVAHLQDSEGWFYNEIGSDLSDEILELLTEMKYVIPQ